MCIKGDSTRFAHLEFGLSATDITVDRVPLRIVLRSALKFCDADIAANLLFATSTVSPLTIAFPKRFSSCDILQVASCNGDRKPLPDYGTRVTHTVLLFDDSSLTKTILILVKADSLTCNKTGIYFVLTDDRTISDLALDTGLRITLYPGGSNTSLEVPDEFNPATGQVHLDYEKHSVQAVVAYGPNQVYHDFLRQHFAWQVPILFRFLYSTIFNSRFWLFRTMKPQSLQWQKPRLRLLFRLLKQLLLLPILQLALKQLSLLAG